MLRHPFGAILVLAVVSSAAAGLAHAQEVGAAGGRLSPRDSAAVLQTARREQAGFERLRRNRLPQTWGGGSSRCDERIGRFCLTHGGGKDDWIAPPEDPRIVSGRADLVDQLAQAAERIPGDSWIAGQRVRYLLEARRKDEAVQAARACRGEDWWCSALLGFALHYSALPADADAAFSEALARMEAEERDRWSDLTMILDDRSAREYKRMTPENRRAFEERFWRLADPILVIPGNELRTEHFARHVWDQLQFRADNTDGISWGYDLREIVLRYGWPTGWERVREWSTVAGPPPLVSHYSSAPDYLLPPPETLLGDSVGNAPWEIDPPRARTGYNIPMADTIARWFSPLDNQIAAFRRGDRALVLAAYQLHRDSISPGATVRSGIGVLSREDLGAPPVIVNRNNGSVKEALLADVPAEELTISLEVVVPQDRRIARTRYDLDLGRAGSGGMALSDLLLLETSETLPDSLGAAVPLARGSMKARRGEQLTLFWEIYGLDPAETPEIALSIRLLEGRTGWLRRLAERAGILREVAPIRLRWQEPVSSGDLMSRALGIQIPNVDPGTYTLELTVEARDREAVSVRRDVEITAS